MANCLGPRCLLYHIPATLGKMTLCLRKRLLRLPVERVREHVKQYTWLRQERRDSDVGSFGNTGRVG